MRIDIMTLFPDAVDAMMNASIIGRAQERGFVTIRTHQIRAHFSHIGHPLFGDGKYGSGREDRKEGAYFQALCAYRLTFCPKGDFGCLSYLAGKTFSLPPEEIPLLTRFPFFSPENRNI